MSLKQSLHWNKIQTTRIYGIVALLFAHDCAPFIGIQNPENGEWMAVRLSPDNKGYVRIDEPCPTPIFIQELTVPYKNLEKQSDGSFSVSPEGKDYT